jgi:hypothetical protein
VLPQLRKVVAGSTGRSARFNLFQAQPRKVKSILFLTWLYRPSVFCKIIWPPGPLIASQAVRRLMLHKWYLSCDPCSIQVIPGLRAYQGGLHAKVTQVCFAPSRSPTSRSSEQKSSGDVPVKHFLAALNNNLVAESGKSVALR